ncbi:UNVERIFIED_CONTAM: hypothetical protein HHA_258970 [Hammondia hammondi]|eukprot:XP_008883110.1 hypothetical protein HHA_258970 [Hammondia hammondi]
MDSATVHHPLPSSRGVDSQATLPASSSAYSQPASLPQGAASRLNPLVHAATSSSAASQYAVFSDAAACASEWVRQVAVADETDGSLENKLRGVGAWAGGCTYTQATDLRSYEENRHAFSLGQAYPEVVPLPPVLQRLLRRPNVKVSETFPQQTWEETGAATGGFASAVASAASSASPFSPTSSLAPRGVLPRLQLLWVAEGATLHLWPLPGDSGSASSLCSEAACDGDDLGLVAGAPQKRLHARRLMDQQRLLHSTLSFELPASISCLEHVLLPRSLLPPAFAASFLFFSASRSWRRRVAEGGLCGTSHREAERSDADFCSDPSALPDLVEATHFHALVAVSTSAVSILALGSPSTGDADENAIWPAPLPSSVPSSLQLYEVASLPLGTATASPFASLFGAENNTLEITAVGVHHAASRIFFGDKFGSLYELRLLPLPTSGLLGSSAETRRFGLRKIRRRDSFAASRSSERAGRRGDAETPEPEEEALSACVSSDEEEMATAREDDSNVEEVGLFECRLERLGASLVSRVLKGACEAVSSAFAFLPSRRSRAGRRQQRLKRTLSATPPERRADDRDEARQGSERILSITADDERGALWVLNAASDVALLLLNPPALSPDGTLVETHPPVTVVRLKRREMERQIGADFRNWTSPPAPVCGATECPQCVSSSRFSFRSPLQAPLFGGGPKGLFGLFGAQQELRVLSAHPTAPHEAESIAVVLLDERGGRIYLQLENFRLVSRLMGETAQDSSQPPCYPQASSPPFLRVAWYRPAPAAAGFCGWPSSISRSGDGAFGSRSGPNGVAPGGFCGARHRKLKLGYYAQGAAVLLFEPEEGEKEKSRRDEEREGRQRAASESQAQMVVPTFERLVAIAPDLEVSAREATPSTSSWYHAPHDQRCQQSSSTFSGSSRRIQPLKESFAAFPLCASGSPACSSSFAPGESLWVGEVPCSLGEGAVHGLSEAAAFTLPSPFDIAKRIHWRYLPYRDVLSSSSPATRRPSSTSRGARGASGGPCGGSGGTGLSPQPGASFASSFSARPSGASFLNGNPPGALPAPPTNPLFSPVEKTIAVAPPPFSSFAVHGRQAYGAHAFPGFGRRQEGPELAVPLSALPALARDQALPSRRVLILTSRCVLSLTFCSLEEIYKTLATRLIRQVEARALFGPQVRPGPLGSEARRDPQGGSASPRGQGGGSFLPFFKRKSAHETGDETEKAMLAAVVAAADSRGREGEVRVTAREGWKRNSATAALPVEQRIQRLYAQLLARQTRQDAERSPQAIRGTYASGVWTPHDPRSGVPTPYGGSGGVGPEGARGWTRLLDGSSGGFFAGVSFGGISRDGELAADFPPASRAPGFLEELFLAYLRDVYTPEQVAAVCWQLLIDFPTLLAPSRSSGSSSASNLHQALRALLVHASEARGDVSLAGLLTAHAGLLFHAAPALAGPTVALPLSSRGDRAFLDLFLRSTVTLSTPLPPAASPLVLQSLRRGDGAQEEADGRRMRFLDAHAAHAVEHFLTPLRRGYVGGTQTRGEEGGPRSRLSSATETGLRLAELRDDGCMREPGASLGAPGAQAHAAQAQGASWSAAGLLSSAGAPFFEVEEQGVPAVPGLSPTEVAALLFLSRRVLVGEKETPGGAGASRSVWRSSDQEADVARLKELENELQQLRQRTACEGGDRRRERCEGKGDPGRLENSRSPRCWLLGATNDPGKPASLQEQQLELQIKQLQLQIDQRNYHAQLSTNAAPAAPDFFSVSPTTKGLLLFVSRLLRPLLFAPLFEAGHGPSGILRSPAIPTSMPVAGKLKRRSRFPSFLVGDRAESDALATDASLLAVAGLAGVQAGQLARGALPVPICMRGRFSLSAVSAMQKKLALLFMVVDAVYTAIFERHVARRQEQIAASQVSPTPSFASCAPFAPSTVASTLPPHWPLAAFSASSAAHARDADSVDAGFFGGVKKQDNNYAEAVNAASRAAIVWGSLPSHEQEELQQLFAVSRMLLLCNEALAAYRLLLREVESCAQLGRRRLIDPLQFDRVLCLNLSLLCSERSSREDFRQFVFSCVSVQSPALAQLCTGALFTPQELRAHSALMQLKSFIDEGREALEQTVFQQKVFLSRFLAQHGTEAETRGASSLPSFPAPSPAVLSLQTQILQFVGSQLVPFLFFFPMQTLAELLVSVQMYRLLVNVVHAKAEELSTRHRLAGGACRQRLSRLPSPAEQEKEIEESCYSHVTSWLQRFLDLHLEARQRQCTSQGVAFSSSPRGDGDAEALFWRMQAAALVSAVLSCDDENLQSSVFSWIAQAGEKTFPESLLTLKSPYLLPWLERHFRLFALDVGAFYAAAGLSSRAAAEYLAQGLRPWRQEDVPAAADYPLSPRPLDGARGLPSPQDATDKRTNAENQSSPPTRDGESEDEVAREQTAQLLAFDAERDPFCVEKTSLIWRRTALYVSKQARTPSLQKRLFLLAQAKDALQQQTQELHAEKEVFPGLQNSSGDTLVERRHFASPSLGNARAAWLSAQAVSDCMQNPFAPLLVGCVSIEQISESIQMVGCQQGLLRDCLRVFCFLVLEFAAAAVRVKSQLSCSRRGATFCGPSAETGEGCSSGEKTAAAEREKGEREQLLREAVEDFLRDFFAHREEIDRRPTAGCHARTSPSPEHQQDAEEWEIFDSLLDLMKALQTTVYSRSELLALADVFWRANRFVQDESFSSIFPSITALQLLARASPPGSRRSLRDGEMDRTASGGARRDAGGHRADAEERVSELDAEDDKVAAACGCFLAFAATASRALDNEQILHSALDDLLSYPDVGLRRVQRRLMPEYLLLLHKFVEEQELSLSSLSTRGRSDFSGEQSRFVEELLLHPSRRLGGDDACTECLLLPPALWPAWMILHRRVPPETLVDAYLHLVRTRSPAMALQGSLTPQVQATIFAWLFDAWLVNEENSTSGATFIKTFSFYLSEGKLPFFETPNDCLQAQLSREQRGGALDACRKLTRMVLTIGAALAAVAVDVPQLKELEMYRSACLALDTFQSKLSLYASALQQPLDS